MKTNDFLNEHFNTLLDTHFTANLEDKLDEIANETIQWKLVINDFYGIIKPTIDTLKSTNSLTNKNNDKKRLLGNNKDGLPIYAYIAQYGPVFQIGDKKNNIRFVPINNPYDVLTVTLEDYYKIDIYPKNLGIHDGNDVYMKKGKNGFYIEYKNKTYNFENMNEETTLNDFVEYYMNNNTPINNDNNNDNNNNNNKIKLLRNIGEYVIYEGPYGPFIKYKTKNYKIINKYNIENMTTEDCKIITTTIKKK